MIKQELEKIKKQNEQEKTELIVIAHKNIKDAKNVLLRDLQKLVNNKNIDGLLECTHLISNIKNLYFDNQEIKIILNRDFHRFIDYIIIATYYEIQKEYYKMLVKRIQIEIEKE